MNAAGPSSTAAARLSWDDLRIILAIGEKGALAAAADMLRVDSSTIARRLAKAEEALGATLFERRRTGHVATAHGEELVALAKRVELDLVRTARSISGSAQGDAGEVRVTTSDSILCFLAPVVASFRAANPAVTVDVMVGNSFPNLARGEADIALRAADRPPEQLFGRQAATIAWAPYSALRDPGPPGSGCGELFERQWVSYSGALSVLKARRFVDERVPGGSIGYRTDTVAGAAAAVAAGAGVAYLPCMLGDPDPRLRRVGAIERELDDQLWLLTHPDIRKSGRIRSFMKHCGEAIRRSRDLIEGLCGNDPVETAASRPAARGGAFLKAVPAGQATNSAAPERRRLRGIS